MNIMNNNGQRNVGFKNNSLLKEKYEGNWTISL